MDAITSEKIRNRFGAYSEPQPHDHHFVYIKPTLTVEECTDMFNEMTSEIFEKYASLLEKTTLVVHISFPKDKKAVYPIKSADSSELLNNSYLQAGVTNVKIISPKLYIKTGILEHVEFSFLTYGTKQNFLYFQHYNTEKYDSMLKEKLARHNINPEHEWTFIYGSPGATMGKHIDFILPSMRYGFAVNQPVTTSSIIIDNVDYYMPTGTAYIMDGTLPHSVEQNGTEPRIILSGAVIV